jgi:hypothetical protein
VPGGSTGVTADVLVLVAVVVAVLALTTLLMALRRLLESRWALPSLPADDQPPAGLGRLVPVGVQVDDDYRRGVVALENWLLQHRWRGT